MKKAVILRGPSGSGKSTWIRDAYADTIKRVICSADYFFYSGSVYDFDSSKLGEAHAECLASFIKACQSDIEVVIVDNTNIHNWEWRNYELIAMMAKRKVEFIEFHVDSIKQLILCQQRNVHKVDPSIIARQVCEFEPHESGEIIEVSY